MDIAKQIAEREAELASMRARLAEEQTKVAEGYGVKMAEALKAWVGKHEAPAACRFLVTITAGGGVELTVAGARSASRNSNGGAPRPGTASETFLALYDTGQTVAQIAKATGKSSGAIGAAIKRYRTA